MSGASSEEARSFATAFQALLDWLDISRSSERNEVVALVQDFLGPHGSQFSVLLKEFPVFDHVNLQTAVNAWTAHPGRSVDVRGISAPPHYGPVKMQQLVTGERIPPLRLSAPALVDLPNGPGSSLACFQMAILLVTDQRGRYIVMICGPSEHAMRLVVEIAGLSVESTQAVFAEMSELMHRLKVYRRQVLDVGFAPNGSVALEFRTVSTTARDDVVLPEAVLERVERHAFGVAEYRDALLAAEQHLKRGLLLYGPPGSGKTYTTRYLVARMEDYTRLILTGGSLTAIGSVAELARNLQPAVVVLEDVDLVAEDRSFGFSSNSVLFDLLDAMDGAAPDADLLFLLTTNRADLLERALAARPGRVDVAVEIALPDAAARRRLFRLYGRAVPLRITDKDIDAVVERTDGVTASFLKELLRRAVLETLHDDGELQTVSPEQLFRALDELLDGSQAMTRSLLGVGNETLEPLPGSGGAARPKPGRAMGRATRMPQRYSDR